MLNNFHLKPRVLLTADPVGEIAFHKMTLLAIEFESLNSEPYIPLITQILETVELRLYIVIYLCPELRSKLDSSAKRVGHYNTLQKLVSSLYICTASNTEASCDIVFADWCGYDLAGELWEYNALSIPECELILCNF